MKDEKCGAGLKFRINTPVQAAVLVIPRTPEPGDGALLVEMRAKVLNAQACGVAFPFMYSGHLKAANRKPRSPPNAAPY